MVLIILISAFVTLFVTTCIGISLLFSVALCPRLSGRPKDSRHL